MTTQSTPGPWRKSKIPGDTNILDDGNNLIAIVPGWPGIQQEEWEANAQLIAATPALLAALKNLLATFAPGTDLTTRAHPVVRAAMEAIAQAEKGQS